MTHTAPATIRVHSTIETLPIDALVPYARNSRTHSAEQVAQIAASIREFGFTNPVLIDEAGGIIAGHGRVLGARAVGLLAVPCLRLVGLSDAQKRAYVIADNKLALNAGWDDALLRQEMQSLQDMNFDMDLLGFSNEEMTELMASLSEPERTAPDPDSVPEISETVMTSKGDIWLLGKHRVMCGDSTDKQALARLMDGNLADCSVTSPPYAMQRKESYGGIEADEYPQWFQKISKGVMDVLADHGSFFVNIKEHVEDGERSLYVFETIKAMRQIGWRYVDQMIWAKNGIPAAWPNRLKNDFEPVHFFTKRDQINWMVQVVDVDENRLQEMTDLGTVDLYEDIYHFTKLVKIKFNPKAVGKKSNQIRVYSKNNGKSYQGKTGNTAVTGKMKSGIARPGNVLWLQGNTESIKHTAMFPVSLPTFFIKLTTDVGDSVYEPFGGAGTTIIAAEQTGRRGFAMELQPKYCDVIVRRWQAFTGKRATLEATGEPFPLEPVASK